MSKLPTAAAVICALFSTGALAQVLTAGQYYGVTQYTGLDDPSGVCASSAGLAVGQVTTSISTVLGFGKGNASTIADPGSASAPTGYGVQWINCTFPDFPAATAFTKQSNGSYTDSPTTAQVTTCSAENGVTYTLTSSNGSSGGVTQTDTITIIPPLKGSKSSSFKLTSGNTAVAVGGTVLCYLSTDALYSRSGK
jgi:hypothetical protein